MIAKAAIAEELNVFGLIGSRIEDNSKLVSSSLYQIEQKLLDAINIIKSQIFLTKHEFNEKQRLQKEVTSENIKNGKLLGHASLSLDDPINAIYDLIASIKSNHAQSSGLSIGSVIAGAAGAVIAGGVIAETFDEETDAPNDSIQDTQVANKNLTPETETRSSGNASPKPNSGRDKATPKPIPKKPKTTAQVVKESVAGGVARALPFPIVLGTAIADRFRGKPEVPERKATERAKEPVTPSAAPSGSDRKMWPILNSIAKGEGGYNSSNRGTRNNKIIGTNHNTEISGKKLTEMTIGEIVKAQAQGKIFAAGRYQFIPKTLKVAIRNSGLSEKDKFSPVNQDKLAIGHIKSNVRPALRDYLIGKSNNLEEAMMDLAKEWASFPIPKDIRKGRTIIRRGQSYYHDLGNRSHHTVAEVESMLKNARGSISTNTPETRKISNGKFIKPIDAPINSDFGTRNIVGGSRDHKGIDIAVPAGTKIKASAGGIAKYWYSKTYGNIVEIDHGEGLVSRYAHMRKSYIKKGTRVRVNAGQIIGEVGTTGRSKGNHLHFEILKNGKQVDPEKYINNVTHKSNKISSLNTETSNNEAIRNSVLIPKTSANMFSALSTETSSGSVLNNESSSIRNMKNTKKIVAILPAAAQSPSVSMSTSSGVGASKKTPTSSSSRYKEYFG